YHAKSVTKSPHINTQSECHGVAQQLRAKPLTAMSAFGTKQTLKTTASDAALAAWRRQMKLHVSVESNGAESPA
ncbi:TPA: hypothetical protein ACIPP3_005158, partial [Klebsiella pneumoniae]